MSFDCECECTSPGEFQFTLVLLPIQSTIRMYFTITHVIGSKHFSLKIKNTTNDIFPHHMEVLEETKVTVRMTDFHQPDKPYVMPLQTERHGDFALHFHEPEFIYVQKLFIGEQPNPQFIKDDRCRFVLTFKYPSMFAC